jgi:hypothetical protein
VGLGRDINFDRLEALCDRTAVPVSKTTVTDKTTSAQVDAMAKAKEIKKGNSLDEL